jgi:hypothetical protein
VNSANQYLDRYAAAEGRRFRDWLVAHQAEVPTYDHLVVMPVRAESSALLEAVSRRPSDTRTLLILVINERPEDEEVVRLANRHLLKALIARSEGQIAIAEDRPMGLLQEVRSDDGAYPRSLNVLWVARCGDCALGPKQGVGWARKIGCDLAVVLWEAGLLKSRWIHWTDADARLPAAHYAPETTPKGCVMAPFVHVPNGDDEAVNRGTFLHEIWMRYYVLGLASAGSPYAHHSLGSALSVDVSTYLAVRGVPDRMAGEDFHFLNKARKVGPVQTRKGPPVEIHCRTSSRVPFGTGQAARRFGHQESAPMFMAPWVFEGLAEWLSALTSISEQANLSPLQSISPPVRAVVNALGLEASLDRILERWGRVHRLRYLMTWFDALRTLRFLHTLRDAVHHKESGLGPGRLVWFEALSQSAFVPGIYTADALPEITARRMAQVEAESVGPQFWMG